MSAQRKVEVPVAANENAPQTDAQRVAEYRAAMVEWHARQEAARQQRLAYARNHKPLGEPKWPAIKKAGYSKAYYEGGYRMIIDGCPTRVAAHVKGWPARAKAMLGRGSETAKERQSIEEQMVKLFPAFMPSWAMGMACCVVHHDHEYRADHHGYSGDCWECKRAVVAVAP